MSIESLAKFLGKYFNQPSQIPNVGYLEDDKLNAATKTFTQGQKEKAFKRAKATSGSLSITAFLQEYIKQLELVREDEKPWSAAKVNAAERRQDERRWKTEGFRESNSTGPFTRIGRFRGSRDKSPE